MQGLGDVGEIPLQYAYLFNHVHPSDLNIARRTPSAPAQLPARASTQPCPPPPSTSDSPIIRVQENWGRLSTEWTALFSFLRNPAIDATNWRAEQAMRPAVVTRKVCGGNRFWRGADAQHILTSLIRTATQRQLDPHAVIADLLRTPVPTVAPDLQGPAP